MRLFLINYLKNENRRFADVAVPDDEYSQRRLLQALFNVREVRSVTDEFLKVQDEYLTRRAEEKGVTRIEDLSPVRDDLYIWQGDITTLSVDAIVNAANSKLLGCWSPCHDCIDNAIHTYAGIQLRADCDALMQKQGHDEPTGQAKITNAYNLPCRFVLHTVGPIIYDEVTDRHRELLASCYTSCLDRAYENELKSVAFCCISTGVFRFPNREAAEIAVKTVENYRKAKHYDVKIIFNVFKDRDREIYSNILNRGN